jgi:outer membrane protein TolC
MKCKVTLVAVAVLGGMLIGLRSTSAQQLTMSGAISLATQRNERILQYQERIRQKEYQDLEATGNFLPNISLVGSYTRINEPIQMDLSPIRDAMIQLQAANQVEFASAYNRLGGGAGLTAAQRAAALTAQANALNNLLPPFVETLKEREYKTATFVLTQPIFMGGKLLAAKRYASAEETAAEIELKKTRDEVVQETVVRYLTVVLLDDVVRTREEVLVGMRRHQEDAHRLVREGLVAPHQALRADVAVAEAERALADDANRRSLALLALRHSIGVSDEDPIAAADSLHFAPLTDSLTTLVNTAMVDHPVLQLLGQKRIAAQQKYNAERADFLPQVAAFGKYELYPQYLSILEPRWAVGVQLNLNIFQGFKKYARLQSAKHLESEVDQLQAGTRQQLDLLVHRSYTEMDNARTRYQKLGANITLAMENLRVMNGRFSTGLGTSLDVIDAQLVLEKTRVERAASLIEYYRAASELYAATGAPERITELWNTQEH